jgi:hypothetical protein
MKNCQFKMREDACPMAIHFELGGHIFDCIHPETGVFLWDFFVFHAMSLIAE